MITYKFIFQVIFINPFFYLEMDLHFIYIFPFILKIKVYIIWKKIFLYKKFKREEYEFSKSVCKRKKTRLNRFKYSLRIYFIHGNIINYRLLGLNVSKCFISIERETNLRTPFFILRGKNFLKKRVVCYP